MDEAPGEAGTLEEETPKEDGPSASKRKLSLLLVSLLGQSFTNTEGIVEHNNPCATAEEEILWSFTVLPYFNYLLPYLTS